MKAEELIKHYEEGIREFQDLDLMCIDLSGRNLSGIDFRRANLKGANLAGANLRYADLRNARLNMANLKGADLTWAQLPDPQEVIGAAHDRGCFEGQVFQIEYDLDNLEAPEEIAKKRIIELELEKELLHNELLQTQAAFEESRKKTVQFGSESQLLVNQLSSNIENANLEICQLQNEKVFLQNKISQIESDLQKLIDEFQITHESLRVSKDENTKIESDLQKLIDELQFTRESLRVSKDKNAKLEQERKSFSDNLSQNHTGSELISLSKQLKVLKKHRLILIGIIANMAIYSSFFGYSLYSRIENELDTSTNNLVETKTKLDNVTNELAKTKSNLENTTNNLAKTQKELNISTSSLVEAKTKLENTTNELAETKAKLENALISLNKYNNKKR